MKDEVLDICEDYFLTWYYARESWHLEQTVAVKVEGVSPYCRNTSVSLIASRRCPLFKKCSFVCITACTWCYSLLYRYIAGTCFEPFLVYAVCFCMLLPIRQYHTLDVTVYVINYK